MTHTRSFSAVRGIGLAAVAFVFSSTLSAAWANYTVSYSSTALPSATGPVYNVDLAGDLGANHLTLNPGTPNQLDVTVNNAATTSDAPAGVVQGSVAAHFAAPIAAPGPVYWTAPYFSTGMGSIAMTFASAQKYLGFLWGSVAAGDTLDFYSHGKNVAHISGNSVINAAQGIRVGAQAPDFNDSQYTLINFTNNDTFDSVTLSQAGTPSFEAADFQFAVVNQVAPVPEPASLLLIVFGLAGICLVQARRRIGFSRQDDRRKCLA
jgi:hypothetical protein